MSELGSQVNERDLLPEQRHHRAGITFGDEYYERISSDIIDAPDHYPLYVEDDLRRMKPDLFNVFMTAAANRFQQRAAEDLIEQGVPEIQAKQKAFPIAKAFDTFARALYENNLGVGRSLTHRREGALSPTPPQAPSTS